MSTPVDHAIEIEAATHEANRFVKVCGVGVGHEVESLKLAGWAGKSEVIRSAIVAGLVTAELTTAQRSERVR